MMKKYQVLDMSAIYECSVGDYYHVADADAEIAAQTDRADALQAEIDAERAEVAQLERAIARVLSETEYWPSWAEYKRRVRDILTAALEADHAE